MLGEVGDADDDAVAFPGNELGAGELAVHGDDALGAAQPRHVRHCHLALLFRVQRQGMPYARSSSRI